LRAYSAKFLVDRSTRAASGFKNIVFIPAAALDRESGALAWGIAGGRAALIELRDGVNGALFVDK
jgi:hypothetical protein